MVAVHKNHFYCVRTFLSKLLVGDNRLSARERKLKQASVDMNAVSVGTKQNGIELVSLAGTSTKWLCWECCAKKRLVHWVSDDTNKVGIELWQVASFHFKSDGIKPGREIAARPRLWWMNLRLTMRQ